MMLVKGLTGRYLSFSILALALAILTPSAKPQSVEVSVEGVVKDRVAGQPVQGARVRLGLRSGDSFDAKDPWRGAPSAVTDVTGSFRVHVTKAGIYEVSVEAAGHVAAVPAQFVRVTGEQKIQRVEIIVNAQAAISGRIVDSETKKPVAGLQLRALVARHLRGERSYLSGHSLATTAPDGTFHLDGLNAGECLIEIGPGERETIVPRWEPDYTEERKRPLGYRRAYWPGPGSLDAASPMLVGPGSDLALGDIPVDRLPLYRIRASLESSRCGAGDEYGIAVTQERGGTHVIRARARLECKSSFTVQNLAPGEYLVRVGLLREPKAESESARADTVLAETDADLAIVTMVPVPFNGQVKFPPGFPEDAKRSLRVWIQPLKGAPSSGPAPVGADGGFTAFLYPQGELEVEVSGLPQSYFVKEIQYNGSPLVDSILGPNFYALEQRLTVVVSDRPATLSGTVRARDEAVPDARVYIVPWPARLRNGYPRCLRLRTDESGKFSRQGLAPGTYRLLAARRSAEQRLEAPNLLYGLIGDATDVQIGEGELKSVAVELTDVGN